MTVHSYATPESPTTLLSTELNSASAGAVFTSGVIDNSVGLYKYADFEMRCEFTSAALGNYFSLYLLEAADGTNYEDAAASPNSGEALLTAAQFLGSFIFPNAVGPFRKILRGLVLPPTKFKIVLWVDWALVASGNTLKMIRYTEQTA